MCSNNVWAISVPANDKHMLLGWGGGVGGVAIWMEVGNLNESVCNDSGPWTHNDAVLSSHYMDVELYLSIVMFADWRWKPASGIDPVWKLKAAISDLSD